MAEIATPNFLKHVKEIYQDESKITSIEEYIKNPWYLVASVAFGASNRPDGVPRIFQLLMDELDELSATQEQKIQVIIRMREALFKGGMISGYSRAISALIALYEVTPPELRDTSLIRQVDDDKVSDLKKRGEQLYTAMYGDTADSVQTLLDAIHPDMGWFSKVIAYGHTYNANHVLSQRDTSYVIVSALISMDTPRQVAWHLANCRRGGASIDEVKAIRQIAMKVAGACGITWRNGVPEVHEDNPENA